MKKYITTMALLLAMTLAASTQAALILNAEATLAFDDGVDTLGLNGAHLHFAATFADGVKYQNAFGDPAAAATKHSLTITDASNALSNGSFADPNGFAYLASGSAGQWIDNRIAANAYRTNTIASGLSLKFDLVLSAPSLVPSVGSYLYPTNFASTLYSGASIIDTRVNDGGSASATYHIVPGSFTISAVGSTDPAYVPEPGTLSLSLLGAIGLFIAARRARKPR